MKTKSRDYLQESAITNVSQVLAWYHRCTLIKGVPPCDECLTIARGAVSSITPKKKAA